VAVASARAKTEHAGWLAQADPDGMGSVAEINEKLTVRSLENPE
jgi:hypothetical protein